MSKPLLITRYAIRHKPTGKFLPQTFRTDGRGGTFTKPEEADGVTLPRFFLSGGSAQRSLRAWLRGHWTERAIIPQPDRKAEEMEIVPIYISTTRPQHDRESDFDLD